MRRFSRKYVGLAVAFAGLSTTLLLGLGIWRLHLEKETAKRELVRERMFLSVRTASALAEDISRCQIQLMADPASLAASGCMGFRKGGAAFQWFVDVQGADDENIGKMGPDERLFREVVVRHRDEIHRLLAGRLNPGWVQIGRYVLTMKLINDASVFIGFNAVPESADLFQYLLAKDIVTSNDYDFSLGRSDNATGEAVSTAYVNEKVGVIKVVDPRFAERLHRANEGISKVIGWFGVAGLMVFASLILAYWATRVSFDNAQQRMNFVASVSHEFRTPLASLSLMLETLLADRLSSEERKMLYLEKMQGETARLSRLAENILTLGRLERNSPIRSEVFHIQLPMDAAIEQARAQCHGAGIELAREQTNETVECEGDPALIQIALLNLLDNAIKFSPPQGRVSISVRADYRSVRYSVADQGAGIAPRERKKIFDWFYRSGNERTREKPGSGLGLAIVREVASRHGGKVVLQSEVGVGSVFEMHLPRENKGA